MSKHQASIAMLIALVISMSMFVVGLMTRSEKIILLGFVVLLGSQCAAQVYPVGKSINIILYGAPSGAIRWLIAGIEFCLFIAMIWLYFAKF